jgi:hypothetical protein
MIKHQYPAITRSIVFANVANDNLETAFVVEDKFQLALPREVVREYLPVFPGADPKRLRMHRSDIGPTGKKKDLYRTNPGSLYASRLLYGSCGTWHSATITVQGELLPELKGKHLTMVWDSEDKGHNPLATRRVRQPDAILPNDYAQRQISIRGTVYLVLSEMLKPYINIRAKKSVPPADFQQMVAPLFKGWWLAIPKNDGWRLYADDEKELSAAALHLPSMV